jgi:hypothetical protein
MSLRLVKCTVHVVILIMTFQCVTAAFATTPGRFSSAKFHTKAANSSIFSSLFYEKIEEERENEEEKDKFLTIELADLTRIAIVLSHVHTPHHLIQNPDWQFNLKPSFSKLFCIYLI